MWRKDMKEATRLWGLAALADNGSAQVDVGIALFNGDGVAKNEPAAAIMFRQAALHGNPVARIGSRACSPKAAVRRKSGRGHQVASDIEGRRLKTNITLDEFVGKLDPETRAAGEKAAKAWLDALEEDRRAE